MAETETLDIKSVEWFDKKRNLNGAIRKAKSIQAFIHTDYFERADRYACPRHKVTIQYTLEFVTNIPDDLLPGLALIIEDPLTYLLIPAMWKGDVERDFNLAQPSE